MDAIQSRLLCQGSSAGPDEPVQSLLPAGPRWGHQGAGGAPDLTQGRILTSETRIETNATLTPYHVLTVGGEGG